VEDLREDLLRAGLSPRHVERYLRELSEHRADIVEHLLDKGTAPEAALRQAEMRLGDREALLLPMLADRRFRSYTSRWPALFYLVLPLAAQAALVVAGVIVLSFAAGTSLRPAMAELGRGLGVLLLAAPVLIGWLMLVASRRRRISPSWPVLGSVAGATLAAALQLGIAVPTRNATGEIGLGLGIPSPLVLGVLILLSLLPLSRHARPE